MGTMAFRRAGSEMLRQDQSLMGIANKRLSAAWNKDYLCCLIDLKPKPV